MTVQMKTTDLTTMSSARAGLAKGTIILTLRGEVAVEDLREGDRIITRDVGAQTLRAVKCHDGNSTVIAKDSLGKNSPAREMRLAPGQSIFVRADGPTLVSAAELATSEMVRTTLYRLIFDRAHVIYANGAELAIT